MLGSRVACLMFFARVFSWWVCGVAGEQESPSHVCKCNTHRTYSGTAFVFLHVQVSTGSQLHSGSYPSSQTSAPVPGVGLPLTASWG